MNRKTHRMKNRNEPVRARNNWTACGESVSESFIVSNRERPTCGRCQRARQTSDAEEWPFSN